MTNSQNRRDFLGTTATGLSGIALASLLQRDRLLAADDEAIRTVIDPDRPFAARSAHFPTKVKKVLVIFCSGACSQIDTFDYKPELEKRHGRPMPGAEGLITSQGAQGNLFKSAWKFKPRGESGKMTSDLFPQLGELADDICFIHSLSGKTAAHGPAETFMSTGHSFSGFPSMGSWMSWALGTENEELPAYVAIADPRGKPQASIDNWSAGFLPAAFQGTDFNAINPLRNLSVPEGIDKATDSRARSYLQKLNRMHMEQFPGDTELSARIASYELAAAMQLSVPGIMDFSTESQQTIKAYGADDGSNKLKADYAKNCILARRLLEKGVRFVQLFNGAYQTGGEGISNWDGHSDLVKKYNVHGQIFDQPTAALLKDLKQRGMLEDTLVVWCTEFGRMPTIQASKKAGRDHNIAGFTAWLAGAGVKAPFSFGATDEFGYKAVDTVVTVHDFHATILHLLGINHKQLTYRHNGLDRRLTDVHGNVIEDVLT
ncbi:MAG: DUF1501 domain-containing protein [Fuerstiella sp.]|nr:DUF1501 domain-containing protein [Fuerstiella sp.]MCP4858811.1 DUF1501 domain-containing protein [Fuerstiella sp.]